MDNIITALSAVISNKLRSALTMLGIIIGVFSVILMISIGDAAQKSVVSRIEQMGTNLLVITPGQAGQSNVRGTAGGRNVMQSLTMNDVAMIRENVTGIVGVSPEFGGRKQISFGANNVSSTITGVLPEYEAVRLRPVSYGQFISDPEVTNMDKVAVIGKNVGENLFGNQNPIGQNIKIENNIFTVIGVLTEKGQQGFINADNVVLIPITTALKRIFGVNYVNTIYVSAKDFSQIDQIQEKLTQTLLEAHKISSAADADFTVLKQSDALSSMNQITDIFTYLLAGIAAISLLVGGIGVMNIMLVSVTERTREIGIRKAIGAENKDILTQFLTESTVLCLCGGIIALILSYLAIMIAQKYIPASLNLTVVLSIKACFLGVIFSSAVGLFFGIMPAYKAARLKPIDALRYE